MRDLFHALVHCTFQTGMDVCHCCICICYVANYFGRYKRSNYFTRHPGQRFSFEHKLNLCGIAVYLKILNDTKCKTMNKDNMIWISRYGDCSRPLGFRFGSLPPFYLSTHAGIPVVFLQTAARFTLHLLSVHLLAAFIAMHPSPLPGSSASQFV